MKLKFNLNLCFALISSALLATSCGGSGSSSKVNSKDDANNIISYTNNVVDLLNDAGSWMRSNEEEVNIAIEAPRTGAKSLGFIFNVGVYVHVETSGNSTEKATSSLSKEDQDFFNTNVALFKSNFESLRNNLGTIKDYYKNEDFKDDKFAKGKVLADSIEIEYKAMLEIRDKLFAKIDEVSKDAELAILKDHPLKDPILALKKDLAGFESLYQTVSDFDENKAKMTQVDSVYNALEQSIATNKGLYADILNKENKKSAYDSFYKQCEKSLGIYRKALRDAKDGKALTESNFNDFGYEQRSLVGAYNTFTN